MSLYKFNRFHWHLTDDEGWRLEIKAFPQLTAVGAWRGHGLAVGPQLSGGPDPYGGYYTQSEVRELVSIGRNVTIGERCILHPGVVIGDDVCLGDDVVLYPNVVVYHGCRLGSRVMVHAGAVIG